ncbi:MAG TPA: hypothetical protein PKN85_01210 [Syntrophorhabdaceae bacterium]|nr:hypothetical protein [Syntrophorhabdaceae bacterium]HOD76149.1 hypothetical protein [Syntrophorhabdaceae bacterium]
MARKRRCKIEDRGVRPVWTVLRTAFIIAAAFILSGCIDDTISVTLRTDGSGTIEETVLMGNEFIEMMQGMGKGVGEEGKDRAGQTPVRGDAKNYDAVVTGMMEKAKNNAKDFGEGVSLVSVKPARSDSASGYTAVYSFKDIGKVTLNQNPGSKTPLNDADKEKDKAEGAGSKDTPGKDRIRFVFTKGSPARLAVHMPPPKPADKDEKEKTAPKEPAKDDPNAIEMMKAIFKGMRVRIALTVDGDIVKTNATHRLGRKITLIEMDFGRLISHAELLKKIDREKPQSIEEMKAALNNVEGLKLEFEDPVVVDFK